MKKVLITGGAGYIGTHTCAEMADQGYEIIAIDNFSNSSPKLFKNVAKIVKNPVRLLQVDLCDKTALENVFSTFKPEYTIHLAGFKSVNESVEFPILYYNNNVVGSLNLLDAMSSHGCDNIVFSSSASVYGSPCKLPISETHPVGPESPYGQSKLFIEKIIDDWRLANENRRAICLRYFNPIGAHESGILGELPISKPTNIFPIISSVAAKRSEKLSIFGSDYMTRDGTPERDYIHIMDLARAHAMAVAKLHSHPYEVINVGTGAGTTVKELVKSFEHAIGQKIQFEVVGRRVGDVGRCFAEARKAHNLLNWKAERSLSQSCKDQWKWEQNSHRLRL